jgi:O-antigen ligase/tetratricopeptide (TPR) repeat protein
MRNATPRSFAGSAGWSTSPSSRASGLSDWLLQVVDAGLAGVICVAPFVFGGRHDLGRLVLVILIGITVVTWFARQALDARSAWKDTAAYTVLLLAVLVVGLQIVPLPSGWLAWMSPRLPRLLPLWQGGGESLGAWNTLSIVPHETAKGLAMLIAYGMLFIVAVQRIESVADVAKFMRWLGISATAMATFGLVQLFTANGNYFWFYEHPYRTTVGYLCGSFMNRNHFASFLVLGVVPLAAWLIDSLRENASFAGKDRGASARAKAMVPLMIGAALAVVIFAIVLSLSRGGILALLAAVVVAGAIYARFGLVDAKQCAAVLGLAVVVVSLLSVYGYDIVARRLSSLTQGSMEAIDSSHGRRLIWSANIAAFRDGGLMGAGVGTHRMIYPVYLPRSFPTEFTHAESGYLQVATETGAVGVLLLTSALALCASWCVRMLRQVGDAEQGLWAGAICAGLAASAVHSLVDFVWYIPACISLTTILAACALRMSQLNSTASKNSAANSHRRLMGYRVALPLVLVASIWPIWTFVAPACASIHWDRYQRLAVANRDLSRELMSDLIQGETAAPGNDTLRADIFAAMSRHLERAVAWDPEFSQARIKLSSTLVSEFERRQREKENAMVVDQVADAALASRFESAEQVRDWLRRAFGDDSRLLEAALANARAGVASSPCDGAGYVLLAKLSFVEGGDRRSVAANIEQGQRVRPFDADLLYHVGNLQSLRGDLAAAMQTWQRCFRDAGPHQLKIIYVLAGRVPAGVFLEAFQPDWHTLPKIWARYRELGQPQDLVDLVNYSARLNERGVTGDNTLAPYEIWMAQALMYRDLERSQESLVCLQHAYRASPFIFSVRYELAKSLMKEQKYADAEPHLRWCLARRPGERQIATELAQITARRRDSQETLGRRQPTTPRSWTN